MIRGSSNSSARPPEHTSSTKEREELPVEDGTESDDDGTKLNRIDYSVKFTAKVDDETKLRKRIRNGHSERERDVETTSIQEEKTVVSPQGVEQQIPDNKKAVDSSQGVSEELPMIASSSNIGTTSTTSGKQSNKTQTNSYYLTKPIEGVRDIEVEEIRKLNEVLDKPSIGGEKRKKTNIPTEEQAPHGAQLKLGRRKKYATKNETVISDKEGRSKIVRQSTLDNECNANVALVHSIFLENQSDTKDIEFIAKARNTSKGIVYNLTNAPREYKSREQDDTQENIIKAQPKGRTTRMMISAKIRLPGGSRIPSKREDKGKNSTKLVEIGMDDHADVCVIPARLLPEGFDNRRLKKVDGRTSGVTGHALKIMGETKLDVKLSEVWFCVRFLVVEDHMPYPLLGNDFRHYTQATMDWSRKGFKFEVPGQK